MHAQTPQFAWLWSHFMANVAMIESAAAGLLTIARMIMLLGDFDAPRCPVGIAVHFMSSYYLEQSMKGIMHSPARRGNCHGRPQG